MNIPNPTGGLVAAAVPAEAAAEHPAEHPAVVVHAALDSIGAAITQAHAKVTAVLPYTSAPSPTVHGWLANLAGMVTRARDDISVYLPQAEHIAAEAVNVAEGIAHPV